MNYIIIQPNNINYCELDKKHSRLNKKLLEEDIEEYVKIYDAKDSYDGMQYIIEKCEFKPDELIYNTIISISSKYIYYMTHTIEDNNKSNKDINKIAIYLSKNKYKITGSVGIIKEEILTYCKTKISLIKFDEMLDIYYNNLVYTGIRIVENGDISEFKYILNPIDWMKPEETQNYKFIEFTIFDKVIMIFIELKPKNDIINEKASILYNKKINGTVYISMRETINDIKQTDFIYENLDINTINKLINVLSVNQEDIKETEAELKNMSIVNFYTILDKRYYNFLNKKDLKRLIYNNKFSVNKLAVDLLNKKD